MMMRFLLPAFVLLLAAEERTVNPTFLRTNLSRVTAAASAFTPPNCRVYPMFGEGTAQAGVARGEARFARLAVSTGKSTARSFAAMSMYPFGNR